MWAVQAEDATYKPSMKAGLVLSEHGLLSALVKEERVSPPHWPVAS